MAKIVTSTRRKRSSSRQLSSKVLLGAVVFLLGCFLLWYFFVERNGNEDIFLEQEVSIPKVKEAQGNEVIGSSVGKTNFALPQPTVNKAPIAKTSNANDNRKPFEDEPVEVDASKTNLNSASKVKHFPHKTEQLLALVLSTPPDGVMPPLPHLSPNDEKLNDDALLATTNVLVIYENDGAKLEGIKVDVADIKEQLAEIVAGGGNVADALNELRDYQNDGVKLRKKAIERINAIEDDDEAADFFIKVNKTLEAEGIAPIKPEEVGFSNFNKVEK